METKEINNNCSLCYKRMDSDYALCDSCLLSRYMDLGTLCFDSQDDFATQPMYKDYDVIKALRRALGEIK